MITEALQPPQQTFNELKRQKQQLPITMSSTWWRKNKCPLSKILSHQHHLCLTSSSHQCFSLHSLLHLLKKMILMTLLPFHQKVNIANHTVTMSTPSSHFISSLLLLCCHQIIIISDNCSNKQIGEFGEYP